jgi:[ribosomal protein S5]-alanine N-acetyltransferase
MRVIEAPSLRLEPQTAAHAEEMFAVLSDPAIYEHENAPPQSAAWLRDRFSRLESRCSPDATQLWLNWVIRVRSAALIGYVQATVHADGRAGIAYELASAHWGRGLAHQAVQAMLGELVEHHGVRGFFAVLKRSNIRSRRLLDRLGFALATDGGLSVEDDEIMMVRDSPASP